MPELDQNFCIWPVFDENFEILRPEFSQKKLNLKVRIPKILVGSSEDHTQVVNRLNLKYAEEYLSQIPPVPSRGGFTVYTPSRP